MLSTEDFRVKKAVFLCMISSATQQEEFVTYSCWQRLRIRLTADLKDVWRDWYLYRLPLECAVQGGEGEYSRDVLRLLPADAIRR